MVRKLAGKLKAAHEGYRYQDLVTAYIFAQSLIHRFRAITVDRKAVEDDRFDDIEIADAIGLTRCQVKWSRSTDRKLSETDFCQESSSLRIDQLVLSYIRAGNDAADEYRLCATWQIPDKGNFLSLLDPAKVPAIISESDSHRFQIRGEMVWPRDGQPLWTWLGNNAITRSDFLNFCKVFFLELNFPRASGRLYTPGPLESILLELLVSQIGIGKYPNKDRKPEDVAALLIAIASYARSREARLTPEELEELLNLRTDYGKISQRFPLDEKIFQDRKVLRPALYKSAFQGKHQIVVGPPGTGKSWELTKLADELINGGALVARHYCYLEPGDELIERRITADVFFANLMAELTEAEPMLRDSTQQRYSAGPKELEELLEKAIQFDKPIVLIVDGLDHIARVLIEARTIADFEANIIEQIATLHVPPGITLIFGSQPGEHLNSLYQAFGNQIVEHQMQPWSIQEVTSLAHQLGVGIALKKIGNSSPEPILGLIANRSEGNPLYATYLCRELVIRIEAGTIVDVEEWLQGTPVIQGEIAVYYRHLYSHASKTAKAIADVIGVIDFGVSEVDLSEILPTPLRGWIPGALKDLNPILTTVSSQGGVRIFHESFRRFMIEELTQQGRSIADASEPLIEWLQGKGFFRDAKAYRFLLPALNRADRIEDALSLVDTSFVSKSITHGHPFKAIERNLALVSDIAAHNLRWPDLVRYLELSRSAYTCFEEKLYNPVFYWDTYCNLFGANALAERLLFDGKITQEPQLGLVLCSLADDMGGTPPWSEYLEEYNKLSSDDDQEGSRDHKWQEQVSLARLHGRFLIEGFEAIARSILDFLVNHGENHARPRYVRSLAARIAKTEGREAVEALIVQGTTAAQTSQTLSPRVIALLKLGLAEALFKAGDQQNAAEVANEAVDYVGTPTLSVACLHFGASVDRSVIHASNLSALDLGLNGNIFEKEVPQIRNWVASVRLLAHTDPEQVENERNRIDGEGWYRCWLRFVITLAQVEAALLTGSNSPNILQAFHELTEDIRPFKGKPRACDLYQIHGLIQASLKWGVSLLNSQEEWIDALASIHRVLDGTSTSLSRSHSGPLYVERVLKILLPYASNPDLKTTIRQFSEDLVANDEKVGTYFEQHAEQSMMLSRIYKAMGEEDAAQSLWGKVGIFLTGYGFRKDTTIYEIIDSAPTLATTSPKMAIRALIATQPLADSLLRHTDGRSTNRAPIAWFRSLLKSHTPTGLELLARSMSVRDATTDWPLEEALHAALKQTSDSANPLLLEALYYTLPFEVEYEGESEELANERLKVVSRLLDQDSERGRKAFYGLYAQVEGDGRRYTDGAKKRLQKYGNQHGIALSPIYDTEIQPTKSPSEKQGLIESKRKESIPFINNLTILTFPVDTSFVELVTYIRRNCDVGLRDKRREKFINSFGYRLVNLMEDGREEQVIRLIQFFARTYRAWDGKVHPLADIGEGLERFGYFRAAAVAYGLAYMNTHGGHGWFSIGDSKHESVLLRGIELGRQEVIEIVASEVAYSLRNINFNHGISRNLIDRLNAWGEPQVAQECWWAAYDVIRHRLPTKGKIVGWFEQLELTQISDWSVDEGLVAVLFGRLNHPNLYRKIPALSGIVEAVKACPDNVLQPLRHFLTKDTPSTSILLVFETLITFESEPYQITAAVADLLKEYAKCELWGVRMLAQFLLDRIGINIPKVIQVFENYNDAELTNDQIERILSIDDGKRSPRLDKIDPGISHIIARRFRTIFDRSDIHKERCRTRYEIAFGRDGNVKPSTPLLFWEQELFEIALHQTLNGIYGNLWATGNWSDEIETQILSDVLPNIIAHLSFATSRVARPNYPLPSTLHSGRGDIISLGDHPIFPGWHRVAYFEEQWRFDDNSHYEPPKNLIRVFAGAFAEPFGRTPQPSDFPFRDAQIMDWWYPNSPIPMFPPQLPLGPLMRIVKHTDWLGRHFILVPPIEIRSYIHLMPAEPGAPLIWTDRDGQPAVVCQTWRVRDHRQMWGEPREYAGSEILMRPDIFERTQQIMGTIIRELKEVCHIELETGT